MSPTTFRKKIKRLLYPVKRSVQSVCLHHPFYCPVCEKKVLDWKPFVRRVGENERRLEPAKRLCPHCNSFERTRQIKLFFSSDDVLRTHPRVLHFAPEKTLSPWLRKTITGNYVTADLFDPTVDRKEDITNLTFPEGSFDLVYCSNVLEHVEDDRSAMAELFRVLSPGGLAILQVPIKGETTYEDFSIRSMEKRAKHFGQADHVRWYGRDFADRLRAVGFLVEEKRFPEFLSLSEEDLTRMNLHKEEFVYFCSKPSA